MINEPSGWSADCDLWSCKNSAEQDDHVDGVEDWTDTLRQWGWIVLGEYNVFCSLECLLLGRADSGARKHMGDMLQIHASYNHDGSRCCPDHGKHRSDDTHDWRCPVGQRLAMEARRASAAALREAGSDGAVATEHAIVVTTIAPPAYVDPKED